MVAHDAAAHEPVRLNPFVFPQDTTFRFVLLMISIIGASLFMYTSLAFNPAILACEADSFKAALSKVDYRDLSTVTENGEDYAKLLAAEQVYLDCLAPHDRASLTWQIGGVALLLAVAVGIYLAFPAVTIRRGGLVPLHAADRPELVAYLQTLL